MTPAIELLERARIAYRLHSYQHDPGSPSYGLEAADKLGLAPELVFKTLLAATDKKELLVALVAVDRQLDLKALARAAGVKKIELASPQQAQRASGYLVGGISPLGQKRRLRTFIDQSARDHSRIYVSAGRRGLELELSVHDLARLTQAQFADLAAG